MLSKLNQKKKKKTENRQGPISRESLSPGPGAHKVHL